MIKLFFLIVLRLPLVVKDVSLKIRLPLGTCSIMTILWWLRTPGGSFGYSTLLLGAGAGVAGVATRAGTGGVERDFEAGVGVVIRGLTGVDIKGGIVAVGVGEVIGAAGLDGVAAGVGIEVWIGDDVTKGVVSLGIGGGVVNTGGGVSLVGVGAGLEGGARITVGMTGKRVIVGLAGTAGAGGTSETGDGVGLIVTGEAEGAGAVEVAGEGFTSTC